MNPWMFIMIWIASQSLQIALGCWALFKRPGPDGRTGPGAPGRRRLGSLMASAFASILPLMTLILFLRVFVIGGSSNVAQLAGDEGYDLWHLWFSAWPLLLLGDPAGVLIGLVALAIPP